MTPDSNQPRRYFATAKTHKFESFDDINIENLRLRPIIDQTGTCYYNASKVIAEYLKPIANTEFIIADTQSFPTLLKDVTFEEDEEDVSYDVESLFTSIPIKETIEYICDEIYVHKKLKPMCKRSIFVKLLYKLTTDCIFTANGILYKQTDGVSMGGPLSVIFSGCFMSKMEREVVAPRKPKFYKRFVDDIYTRRRKNIPDDLFIALNNFHPNINLTIEVSPTKFLDTNIIYESDQNISFRVYDNPKKILFHWSSQVPKRYKRNITLGELHRSNRISSDFEQEVKRIKSKFLKAGYPIKFIISVINSFKAENNETIIPNWLYKEKKEIYVRLPYCQKNEKYFLEFSKRLSKFTNDEIDFKIIWSTRNIKSLFPLKDKITYKSNVIYEGKCTCGGVYIGETKRNAETRWSEHSPASGKSEPAKHIRNYHDHE